MVTNEWYDIKGYEGLYQINKLGERKKAGGYIWRYKND